MYCEWWMLDATTLLTHPYTIYYAWIDHVFQFILHFNSQSYLAVLDLLCRAWTACFHSPLISAFPPWTSRPLHSSPECQFSCSWNRGRTAQRTLSEGCPGWCWHVVCRSEGVTVSRRRGRTHYQLCNQNPATFNSPTTAQKDFHYTCLIFYIYYFLIVALAFLDHKTPKMIRNI